MSQEMLNEFAITELEDRLEFAEICNDNCKCGGSAESTDSIKATPTDGEQAA
jgi:hypothetical protein